MKTKKELPDVNIRIPAGVYREFSQYARSAGMSVIAATGHVMIYAMEKNLLPKIIRQCCEQGRPKS